MPRAITEAQNIATDGARTVAIATGLIQTMSAQCSRTKDVAGLLHGAAARINETRPNGVESMITANAGADVKVRWAAGGTTRVNRSGPLEQPQSHSPSSWEPGSHG